MPQSDHSADVESSADVLEDITVLIPTLGRRMLLECLQSIKSGTTLPAATIVVDQGWNETNAADIRALSTRNFSVTHVRSGDRGRAAGVNQGLRLVETRYVAITDDDCLVDKAWLQTARRLLGEFGEAVITGRVVLAEDAQDVSPQPAQAQKVWRRRSLKMDPLAGGNMAMAISVLQRAGYFDEDARMMTAEDCEWSYRVLRERIPIVYSGDMAVIHRDWRNADERRAQFSSYARSHGAWYGKHLRNGDLFILPRLATHHARALKRWVLGSLRRDSDLAENGKAYFTGLLPGLATTLWNRPGR